MSHTPHELAEDFPDHIEKIRALKQSDAHFAKLASEYHDINRAVHRAETGVEPVGQRHENRLRKQRAALKDELHRILSSNA